MQATVLKILSRPAIAASIALAVILIFVHVAVFAYLRANIEFQFITAILVYAGLWRFFKLIDKLLKDHPYKRFR